MPACRSSPVPRSARPRRGTPGSAATGAGGSATAGATGSIAFGAGAGFVGDALAGPGVAGTCFGSVFSAGAGGFFPSSRSRSCCSLAIRSFRPSIACWLAFFWRIAMSNRSLANCQSPIMAGSVASSALASASWPSFNSFAILDFVSFNLAFRAENSASAIGYSPLGSSSLRLDFLQSRFGLFDGVPSVRDLFRVGLRRTLRRYGRTARLFDDQGRRNRVRRRNLDQTRREGRTEEVGQRKQQRGDHIRLFLVVRWFREFGKRWNHSPEDCEISVASRFGGTDRNVRATKPIR